MPPVAVDHSYVNLSKSEYDSQPSTSQPPVIPARRNKPIRTTDHIATSPVLPDIARRTKTASNIVEGQGRQKEDEEDTYNNQALSKFRKVVNYE
ncbi:unnamed protein product [Protopolystoma xenopodis]|uniref:Uncharacterized protein n=1 Tax=Protopolystoma xenopodis TaxID=117903 RepID=A0A3S5B7J4_9PLAT|nr:unnamed protein product [Protopolystoma xenopodis]